MDQNENLDSSDYDVNIRMIAFSIVTVVFILVAIFFIKTYTNQKKNILHEMSMEWKGLECYCTEKIERTEYLFKLLAIQIEKNPNDLYYVKSIFEDYINKPKAQKIFNLKECLWFNYELNSEVRSSPENNKYVSDFVDHKTQYPETATYSLSNNQNTIHGIMGIRDPLTKKYIGSVVIDFDSSALEDRLSLRKKHEYTNFAIINENNKILIQSNNKMSNIGLDGGNISNPKLIDFIKKIDFKEDSDKKLSYLDMLSGVNYYVKKIPNQPFILLINIDHKAMKKDIFYKVVMKFMEISFFTLGFLLLIIRIYKRETTLRAKAEKATKAKSDFLAFTAHEIRSPLGFIVTGSEVIQKQLLGPVPETYREYVDGINRNSHLILDFITDILNEARILEGSFKIVNKICTLKEIIENAVKINQIKLDEKHSKIEVTIAPKLPKLICDPKHLFQILNNLISNAIKYSSENSTINVIARINNECLYLEVIDQGFGMTKEEITIALTKYGTVHKEHSNFIDSYGLGLPIVKMLLDAHDLKLVIKSTVNVGTTMRIIFPKDKLVYGTSKKNLETGEV